MLSLRKTLPLQAGGAPNGGGNIDNKNMVTILEGLKLVRRNAVVSHFKCKSDQFTKTGSGQT